MSTSREDIKMWLDRVKGKEEYTHMLVVCDTFDYEDYPVYVKSDENVKQVYEKYSGKNMQRVMEVYNFKMDIESQLLSDSRVMNF